MQLDQLLMGFSLALTWKNLGFAFLGCTLGTLIGVLPGIGPLATISMLLSITVYFDPLTSLIMLSGIYYGAQYGGSTTAILCRIPGEASSIVTCLDGYQMAQSGRAGAALATAALGSLFAGCVGTMIIALFGPALAEIAMTFNAPEYFALVLLGLVAVVVFSHGSALNATAMACLGVLLGLIGQDIETGAMRFTFRIAEFTDGLGIVAVGMGLFGLSEIILNLRARADQRIVVTAKLNRVWLTAKDFAQAWPAAVRGTALGSLLGVLPGGGVMLSTFAAYMLEQKIAREPSRFGTGAIEGVAAPESANNAAAQTSFIPLLTLGIPATPALTLLLGAMILQGIQPGPEVMTKRPELFWGLIASMFIGNVMLVIINLPLIGIWVQLLRVPYRILFPAIVVFCSIGGYAVGNSVIDLAVLSVFTVIGVVFSVLGFPLVPLMLGFVLGPLAEENLRRAMIIADGNVASLLQRPILVATFIAIVAMIIASSVPALRKRKDELSTAE